MKWIIPVFSLICLLFIGFSLNSAEQKTEGYSGYYVFDGKMYYYDQSTGAISPLSGEAVLNKAPIEGDLVQELRKEEKNAPLGGQSKVASVSGAGQEEPIDEEPMEYGEPESPSLPRMTGPSTGDNVCSLWGSPLLGSKKYSGKDDCDNDLENALDNLLLSMDKYVEKFDREKTQMMIKSSLDEYNKLTEIKLDFSPSRKMITKTFEKGCICLD